MTRAGAGLLAGLHTLASSLARSQTENMVSAGSQESRCMDAARATTSSEPGIKVQPRDPVGSYMAAGAPAARLLLLTLLLMGALVLLFAGTGERRLMRSLNDRLVDVSAQHVIP